MKKTVLYFVLAVFLFACQNNEPKTKAMTESTAAKPAADLPYTAAYSSQFSTDVSDADLKTVLMSYKDWEDANISGLTKAMGDTVEWDNATGEHRKLPNGELMKLWSTYRDSLSSVKIRMDAWQKMYATDKKEGYVVVWYDETDTYKNGKVDSASYHDINQLKDGRIIWYAQYKRPKK